MSYNHPFIIYALEFKLFSLFCEGETFKKTHLFVSRFSVIMGSWKFFAQMTPVFKQPNQKDSGEDLESLIESPKTRRDGILQKSIQYIIYALNITGDCNLQKLVKHLFMYYIIPKSNLQKEQSNWILTLATFLSLYKIGTIITHPIVDKSLQG